MADENELLGLLHEAYRRVPDRSKGRTVCVDPDPAGGTYEFTEHDWSKRIRELLGITYEPTGV